MGKGKAKVGSRTKAVVVGLLAGKTQELAVLDAGYAVTTARSKAHLICHSPEVVAELKARGQSLSKDDLGDVAMARLMHLMTDPTTDARSLVVGLRLAFEIAGRTASIIKQEMNVTHQLRLAPEAEERIAQRLAQMQRQQEALPGEVVEDAGA